MYDLCHEWGVELNVAWTPREGGRMAEADDLPRQRDNTSAWSLGPMFYQWALRRLDVGPEEVNIDPFSDGVNHRGPVWFSRALAPGCAGIDGLSQRRKDERTNAP